MNMHVLEHALAADVLGVLRDKRTPPAEFRRHAHRLSLLVVAEATRELPAAESAVETPLSSTRVKRLARRVVVVPVLRAGLGMLGAFLELVPGAEVGYLGFERDEHTAVARCYYERLPSDLGGADVFLLDPMLATGGSAASGVSMLQERGARRVRLLTVVAAPEGVTRLEEAVPGTEAWTVAVDRGLDERKFIVPGLGDFGDRLNGA
jgi:uracil phosphoribosyltransferase